MNQEIKEKWISALESGQYEQAKGALRIKGYQKYDGSFQSTTHCALGVLHYGVLGLSDDDLQYKSENWGGITDDEMNLVWGLNDEEKLSFPEIAIWIKGNL